MLPNPSRGLGRSPADQQVLSARELRIDERFNEALAALDRAEGIGLGPEASRLAQAERARLMYYLGRFDDGARAGSFIAAGSDLAAGRAAVAVSANLLALNRGHDALSAASAALVRMRTTRARADDVVDALIQLTHVHAHMGDHLSAINAGRAAVRRATQDASAERLRGRAMCALGFALTYAGNQDALGVLLDAERLERERAGAVWHWVQFCIAVFLRDRGYTQSAQTWLARRGVALRYERAWFALRAGDVSGAATWLRPPVTADERPFVRAVVAATRLSRGGSKTVVAASRAEAEFERLGLRHWSWGTTWLRAQDSELGVAERTTILAQLIEELGGHAAVHWGFFDPIRARHALRLIPPARLPAYGTELIAHLEAWSSPARYDDHALLGALTLLTIDALAAFAAIGLTPAEIRTLTAALETWLETGDASRHVLAAQLGITDSSVRSLISDIREKLGIEGRRGVEPIVLWLAEREFLGPHAAMRAVQTLSGAR
jgi:hypothetical protein